MFLLLKNKWKRRFKFLSCAMRTLNRIYCSQPTKHIKHEFLFCLKVRSAEKERKEEKKNFNFRNNSTWFIIFMFRYQSSSCAHSVIKRIYIKKSSDRERKNKNLYIIADNYFFFCRRAEFHDVKGYLLQLFPVCNKIFAPLWNIL